jgi:hypothetical protein
MADKIKLISYGQNIFEKVKSNIRSFFTQRPHLPGYGQVNGDYYMYDVSLTFSLGKIYKAHTLDKTLNIELELTEMFVNELQISIIYRMYNFIKSIDSNFTVNNINSIINLGKYYKESYLICSLKSIEDIKKLEGFHESSHSFLVGLGEIYKIGEIDNIQIYINPSETVDNKFILLHGNFLEYGILENDKGVKYIETEDDVKAECVFYDIYYKFNSNINHQVIYLE